MTLGVIAASYVASGSALPITDSFNRADSSSSLGTTDTGQPWTALAGTWGITGNKAYKVTGSAQGWAVVESGVSDCTISVTLSGTTNAGGGITFRATDANNNLFIDADGTGFDVYKTVAGSISGIGGGGTTFAAGDVMTVVLSGSSIVIKKNGSGDIGGGIASTFNQTATKHGLRDYTGSVRLDSFSIS